MAALGASAEVVHAIVAGSLVARIGKGPLLRGHELHVQEGVVVAASQFLRDAQPSSLVAVHGPHRLEGLLHHRAAEECPA